MDLNLIRTFVVAAEAGSVTEAAEQLRQPKSTVSRHLARLEEVLERPLVDRSRTGLALTAEGRRLFEQTRESIHLLAPLDRRKSERAGSTVLRLHVPRHYARGPMARVIVDFMAETPGVDVLLNSESRLAEPAREDVDIVVSVGTAGAAGVVAEAWPLPPVAVRLYGAASLFGEAGPPAEAADLARLPLLSSCGVPGLPERLTVSDRAGRATTVAPRVRMATNEIDVLMRAACAGYGLVQLPDFVGEEAVAEGRLVAVLPDHVVDRFTMSIGLTNARRDPAIRRFVDYAVARLTDRSPT